MDQVPEKLSVGEPLSAEELIEIFPALKEVPATLIKQYAVGAAVRRRFREGDIVCEEGEFGSTAFYLVSGEVDIFINNPMARLSKETNKGWWGLMQRMKSVLVPGGGGGGVESSKGFIAIDAGVDLPRDLPLARLGPGDLFGEMTCRTFQPRSATVRAAGDCQIVEMLRVILDMLLGTREIDVTTKASTKVKAATFKGTSFRAEMDQKYRARSLVTHLRSVPLFGSLDSAFFEYLREKAELVSCHKGQVICKQGDAADAFYLIRSGLVRVSENMPGGEIVRGYLQKGDFFGEIGLLYDQARSATCSALNATDLVKISKADFVLMLERFPGVRGALEQIGQARLKASKGRKIPEGLQLDEFLNQGLFEAQNLLLIDLENCTRCDACVNACADAHGGVTRLIRDGLRYDRFLVPTACRSCRDPLCMTQCPVGSIRRKESLEIVIEDWCIGCTKCAELCPFGNINMQSLEVMKDVPVTEKKPAAAPAAVPAPAGAAPVAPAPAPAPVAAPVKKTERKKVTVQKATTCDLCTDLSMPSCVYACPHDAAKRVEPARFLAAQIGVSAKSGRRFSWLSGPADRTTH